MSIPDTINKFLVYIGIAIVIYFFNQASIMGYKDIDRNIELKTKLMQLEFDSTSITNERNFYDTLIQCLIKDKGTIEEQSRFQVITYKNFKTQAEVDSLNSYFEKSLHFSRLLAQNKLDMYKIRYVSESYEFQEKVLMKITLIWGGLGFTLFLLGMTGWVKSENWFSNRKQPYK